MDIIRQQGLMLSRDMFVSSHIGEKTAIDLELARFQKRAGEWKTCPEIFSNWNHRGFRRMHEELYGPKSSVGLSLSLIARGDHPKLKATYNEVKKKLRNQPPTSMNYGRRWRSAQDLMACIAIAL